MNYGDSSAFVLYIDHQGHPAPLSLSYHATASRRLASSVNRHPPSTVVEVDSAYCPQCLSFHDATTAANLGYCPKPSCRLCPICQSVATVSITAVKVNEDDNDDNAIASYKCGRCDWNSVSCGLQTSVNGGIATTASAEDLEEATNKLHEQWKTILEQRNQTAEEHYKSMLSTLTGLAKDQVKGLRSTSGFSTTTSRYFSTTKRRTDGPEGWSVKALEDSVQQRQELYATASQQPVGGESPLLVSLEVEAPLALPGASADSILLQQHEHDDDALTMAGLLPLPIPLRPRKSRRCRAELAEGRPGILLKPKLNPLEGDSSLRTGHGQWWKKVRVCV
jgi:dynactin 4